MRDDAILRATDLLLPVLRPRAAHQRVAVVVEARVLRFLGDLSRSARRPDVFRRCAVITLVVGALLSAVNQGDAILRGPFDTTVALKVLANFLIPFVVSNLGPMRSLPPRRT